MASSGENMRIVALALVLILFTACAQGPAQNETREGDGAGTGGAGTLTFGLPPWPGVTVKTEVAAQFLEEKGYTVEQQELDAGIVYAELATGNLDALLAGWLPVTHEEYWNEHGDRLEQVHVNVDTTWLGLAVPTYVNISSIEQLNVHADEFDSRIVGIEPGAGIMQSTEKAIDTYNLDYDLVSSSTPSMMAEVDAATSNEEWIVFTIWEPHSAFAKFDIKKLDDPEGVYGGGDQVYTVVREGFPRDFPDVYAFLQEFEVSPDTQSEWILEYSDKERPAEEVAREWLDEHRGELEAMWP